MALSDFPKNEAAVFYIRNGLDFCKQRSAAWWMANMWNVYIMTKWPFKKNASREIQKS